MITGTVHFISFPKPCDWAMKQETKYQWKGRAVWHHHHSTSDHFSQDEHPFKPPSLSCLEKHCEPTRLVSKFPLLGIWCERICCFTLVKLTFFKFCFCLSHQVKVIVLGGEKKRFLWLIDAPNELKLKRRWCAYWFTILFCLRGVFLFLLFVCLLAFLLGWVPSIPTYVFGMFFVLLMAHKKKEKSMLWYFLTPPPHWI